MLSPPSLAKLSTPVSFPAFRCLCYWFKKKKEEKENDTGTDTARVFELSGGEEELCWWFFGVSQADWVREEVCEVGDLALEGEILEFMKESKNPEAFPSKKELVEVGRMDLVWERVMASAMVRRIGGREGWIGGEGLGVKGRDWERRWEIGIERE